MPTTPILEQVDQGLVTSRDAQQLRPGELQRARGLWYPPGSFSAEKTPGRTKFNATPEGSAIKSGVFIEFDAGDNLILALVGGTIRKAVATGITGTFSDAVTGLDSTADRLEAIYFQEVWYVCNGKDRPRAFRADGTSGEASFVPESVNPAIALDGTGTGFVLGAGKKILYWVERIQKDAAGIVLRRSGADKTLVSTLTGSGVNVKPVAVRPAGIDGSDGTTHWAIYATGTALPTFPVGAQIGVGEVSLATDRIEDTRTGTNPGLPPGRVYDTVSIIIENTTSLFIKNGTLPIFTTGDAYQDTLMTNDVTSKNKGLVTFTGTLSPESTPPSHFIVFQSKSRDEVVLIRSLGQIAIVCGRDNVYRINNLPKADGNEFARQEVKSLIKGAQGCVGAGAGDIFDFKQRTALAYVSRTGIFATDGFEIDFLTSDIEWEKLVEVSLLSNSRLVNDWERYVLIFEYTPKGGTVPTEALFFHYHPTQIKDTPYGRLPKITGPVTMSATEPFRANIGGRYRVFTCNDDTIYLENEGVTDASGVGFDFDLETRDLSPSQFGLEDILKSVRVHHTAAPGQEATVTLTQHAEGVDDAGPPPRIMKLDRREATSASLSGLGETFKIRMQNTDSLGAFRVQRVELIVRGQLKLP